MTSIQTPLETSTYNKENPYEIRKLSTLIGRLETKETAIGLSDDLSRNGPHLEPIVSISLGQYSYRLIFCTLLVF